MAAFAGAFALAAPSFAAPADPLAGMYGNTVVVTQEDGSSTRIHFREDGTWEQRDDAGNIFRGTFAREGGELCFTLTEPNQGSGTTRECDVIEPGHVVGHKWSTVDHGKTVRYEILKGIQ